ncbi:hypothetical protein SLI_7222 [Streptomyces lividans 1326]|uniref:Uncharacterized protein n=1 Tax=Streptomyces lividans 1326 TaxID=1200984 RepID=A0A7U9HGK2_STRLI|nr:hypothetical protein SLI_7222 [Streptomyces lividans 1326]
MFADLVQGRARQFKVCALRQVYTLGRCHAGLPRSCVFPLRAAECTD